MRVEGGRCRDAGVGHVVTCLHCVSREEYLHSLLSFAWRETLCVPNRVRLLLASAGAPPLGVLLPGPGSPAATPQGSPL